MMAAQAAGRAGLGAAQSSTAHPELTWLLDDLVTRVAPIQKAVVLSRDGLHDGRVPA